MTKPQDLIEKNIVVRASQEQVFDAITDPAKIVKWFPDTIEGNLIPGSRPVIEFSGYGKYEIYVEKSEPHHYFSYRWVPDNEDGTNGFRGDVLAQANCLVEFILESVDEGTRVTVKESGFASLPEATFERARKNNDEGWEYMLNRLQAYFQPA